MLRTMIRERNSWARREFTGAEGGAWLRFLFAFLVDDLGWILYLLDFLEWDRMGWDDSIDDDTI